MHASAAFLLAVAGFAAAQSSTTAAAGSTSSSVPQSGCGRSIDLIIQSCLGSTQPQLAACSTTDYDCLCTQSQNVLTCYNNCMTDPNRFGADSTNVAYCNAADTYGSAASSTMSQTGTASRTSTPTGTQPTSTATTTASSSSNDNDNDNETSATNSASSSSPTESGSAANNLVVPAGLAAIFGLAALL